MLQVEKTADARAFRQSLKKDLEEFDSIFERAKETILHYDWCRNIVEARIGMFAPGIVSIFLFRIEPAREEVDDWIWIIVGDLPPAYITTDKCPNAASALDGYVGAMQKWISAVRKGDAVNSLIPVNVPPTLEWADALESRLNFLNEEILPHHSKDLSFSSL